VEDRHEHAKEDGVLGRGAPPFRFHNTARSLQQVIRSFQLRKRTDTKKIEEIVNSSHGLIAVKCYTFKSNGSCFWKAVKIVSESDAAARAHVRA
jgi:hypothetical protein